MPLSTIATYDVPAQHPFRLILAKGSIVDFSYLANPKRSGIVNACSADCLGNPGGGGVDGAVTDAGGENLMDDRRALPANYFCYNRQQKVRCIEGKAVVTGPNSYGRLNVPYVIHAYGGSLVRGGNASLSSAYSSSLQCGERASLEALAFPLLSTGYRLGSRSVGDVIRVGLKSIQGFDGYAELKAVYIRAFTDSEAKLLVKIASEIFDSSDSPKSLLSRLLVETNSGAHNPNSPADDENDLSNETPLRSQTTEIVGTHNNIPEERVYQAESPERVRYADVDSGRGDAQRYAAFKGPLSKEEPISVKYWMSLVASDSPEGIKAASDLSRIIASSPHASILFETPGTSWQSSDKDQFEFALVNFPALQRSAEHNTDPDLFAEHFAACRQKNQREGTNFTICSFSNLGGDARLVAPLPLLNVKDNAYCHLAAFVRNAPPDQVMEFWRIGAAEYLKLLEAKDRSWKYTKSTNNRQVAMAWFSTHGGDSWGSVWLCLRLDSRPKYYNYDSFMDHPKSSTRTNDNGSTDNTSASQDDDGSMDELAKLVKEAASKQNPKSPIPFVLPTKGTAVLSNELHLTEPENPSDLSLFSGGLKEFDDVRMQLLNVVDRITSDPLQLPQKYIEEIETDTLLGGGYFGHILLGVDKTLGKKFAIKKINPLVVEQSLTSRLHSVHKSFRNEIKILTQLKHPNIAPLYGYYMKADDLKTACLLYELAPNESLDKFWASKDNENTLRRERLSEAKIRTRIALEVATVLRYMHEGLDGGDACYHRDIKSANVCLSADFSVRVIDCGLSKYVTEFEGTISTAGPSGTPGYTCPQYMNDEIPFMSACDVFSFGVLLCEIITGKTSCRRSQHYPTYKLIKRKRLEDDADNCVDWESDDLLDLLIKLAMECMEYEASSRPSIGSLVEQLQNSLSDSGRAFGLDSTVAIDPLRVEEEQSACRICGNISDKSIRCFGSEQHHHCHNCVERHLIGNANKLKYEDLPCLKEGCDSRPFSDDEVAGMISPKFWNLYLTQRSSADIFQDIVSSMESRVVERLRQTQEFQVKLCAGNGLPCPKLFLLVESDRNVRPWRNPKEWARNMKGVKLYLHFVCSHSLQPVSDKCRIKVRYTRNWLKAIAPALNASLELIRLSLIISLNRETPLDIFKINEMEEWAKGLLEDEERTLMEESSLSGSGGSVQTLLGNSLSHVAEKAASSNINWQSEMVPVFDSEKNEPTFVMLKYSSLPRYRGKSLPL